MTDAQSGDLLKRVDGIADRLRTGAVEAERLGSLPDASIAAFREAGLLHFKVPTELGGSGAGPIAEVAQHVATTPFHAAGQRFAVSDTSYRARGHSCSMSPAPTPCFEACEGNPI